MKDVSVKRVFDTAILREVFLDSGVLDCGIGTPGPDLLVECSKNFSIATEHRMHYELQTSSSLFQYGPTLGATEYHKTFAKFLSKHYQDNVDPFNLVVTSGASQGLHLILSVLISMDGVIFVDDVTYMFALDTIEQFDKIKVIPVPFSTTNGVDVDALEQLVREHANKKNDGKIFSAIYYTTPTFHNPTGVTFSPETNSELVKIARFYDILIVCDDVYNIFNYVDSAPTKRLFAYDAETDHDYRGGNIISNGSFSKILSPGIRAGWMECPPRCVQAFRGCGTLKSSGCANHYITGIITSLIELDLLDAQIRFYHSQYKERMATGLAVLDEKLPKDCKFVHPKGGFIIWIEFPEAFDSIKFNEWCRINYKVSGVPGPAFSAQGRSLNCLRLTTAFYKKETIYVAFSRFCDAYKEYQALNRPSDTRSSL